MAAQRAYEIAGVKNPREEISMAEVHDCFYITELVIVSSKKNYCFRSFLIYPLCFYMRVTHVNSSGIGLGQSPVGSTGCRIIVAPLVRIVACVWYVLEMI